VNKVVIKKNETICNLLQNLEINTKFTIISFLKRTIKPIFMETLMNVFNLAGNLFLFTCNIQSNKL
jgi:hypothetical protein